MWAKAPDSIVDVEKWIDEILYGTKVFHYSWLHFRRSRKALHKSIAVLYS